MTEFPSLKQDESDVLLFIAGPTRDSVYRIGYEVVRGPTDEVRGTGREEAVSPLKRKPVPKVKKSSRQSKKSGFPPLHSRLYNFLRWVDEGEQENEGA